MHPKLHTSERRPDRDRVKRCGDRYMFIFIHLYSDAIVAYQLKQYIRRIMEAPNEKRKETRAYTISLTNLL